MAELTTVLQKIDEESGVAWLTFNRPEKKNAMSQKFMAELIAALKELAENEKIKCIVTMGSGDSYSSGLDLYDLRESWKRKRAWDHAVRRMRSFVCSACCLRLRWRRCADGVSAADLR